MKYTDILPTLLFAVLAATAEAQSADPTQHAAAPPDSLARELPEAEVRARRAATRLVGGTFVTDIAGTALQHAGTALDALAQLPRLRVEDGQVKVTGKNQPAIYIDGRPLRDAQELEQLDAADLRRVELTMEPGAEHDSGVDAVLNLVTRRRLARGLSLTQRTMADRRRKCSAVDFTEVNYQRGAWDLFLSGSYNHNSTLLKGTSTSRLMYDGRPALSASRLNNLHTADAGTLKTGFNRAGRTASLGAYYRYNPEHGRLDGNGTDWLDEETPEARHTGRSTRANGHLFAAYADKAFGKGWRLHFDGDYRTSRSRQSTVTTYPATATLPVSSAERSRRSLQAAKLYAKGPLAGGELTIGAQEAYTRTSLYSRTQGAEAADYLPAASTKTRQTSAAAFAAWRRKAGAWNLTAGLRYEYTDFRLTGDTPADDDPSRRGHLLTPDLALGYDFGRRGSISLSYRHVTLRPPYAQLTGSLSYAGRHEAEGGNPALRDERTHRLQLQGQWGDFTLTTAFNRSNDSYAFVKEVRPAASLQLVLHPVNVDVDWFSAFAGWSRAIGCWTPAVTAGLYAQHLRLDGRLHDRPIVSWYFDNTFSLPAGFLLTANLQGSTSGDMQTNRFGATHIVLDAAVSRTFMKKALTLRLAATDLLNSSNHNWTMHTRGVHHDKRQSYDGRGVNLSLLLRLRPRENRYKGQAAAEEELNRL